MAQKHASGTADWNKNAPKKASSIKVPGLWLRNTIYWYRPPMVRGKRPKPFSLETDDEGEAIKKILDWRASPELLEQGEWADDVKRYIEHQTAAKRIGRFYASSRKSVLLAFATTMGINAPRQVTLDVCQRYYDMWAKQNKHTARHYVIHLRVFLGWLKDRRYLASNPAMEVQMMKTKQKAKEDFVERYEVRRLLSAARLELQRLKAMTPETNTWQAPGGLEVAIENARELEFFLYMGFDAGLRKNEMVEARSNWFEFIKGVLHVSETPTYVPKDLENRSIPLTDRFKRFLKREYPKGLPRPWVVKPDVTRGKGLYRYDPSKRIERFMKRWEAVSVKGRRPHLHMFRHSFISNRLIAGVAPFRLCKWSGDDIETLMRHYAHLMAHDDQINRGV